MKDLVLVGFMGTGKSVVGREAAQRLGLPFTDTDEWIELQEGREIAEIFASQGEEAFRRKEEAALETLAQRGPQVLATGGGCLTRPRNVLTLRSSGVLVCLTARPEVLVERTGGRGTRPLLSGAEAPLSRIRELLKSRRDAYRQADAEVDTSDLTVEQAAEEAIALWRQLGGETPG